MATTRRIVSIDPKAVAKLLAWTYGILTTMAAIVLLFSNMQHLITFPIGFLVPGFHLNLNLYAPLTANPLGRMLMLTALVLSYSVTGWISGYLLAALLNLVARRRGGIPATIVEIEDVPQKPTPPATAVDHNQLSG